MPMKYLKEKLFLLANKFVHINENRVLARMPVPMGDAERLTMVSFGLSSAMVCSSNSLLQCVAGSKSGLQNAMHFSSLSLSLPYSG